MDSIKITTNLETLNQEFDGYYPQERLDKVFEVFDSERVLMTSSFGSTSVILLHMISKVRPDHPIYFIDTGYVFPETKRYRDQLIDRLNLNVVDVGAKPNHHRFTAENLTWKYTSDLCCFINKVGPTDKLKEGKEVWISGLLRYQNANREKLNIFEQRSDIIKFHPIIDMTEEEVQTYCLIYELPLNPLVYQGYGSIGCTHCTAKGEGREGRWLNSSKTECGLHT
ncbi:phosphoadenylyl-sulfate reductase [Ekhidna sp.]